MAVISHSSYEANQRRLPIGAEIREDPEMGVHFRVWAPRYKRVEVVIEGTLQGLGTDKSSIVTPAAEDSTAFYLSPEPGGYFSGQIPSARADTLYRYRLDGGGQAGGLFPDPASRFQPFGSEGPSQVIDPGLFQWTDENWKGCAAKGQVLYEMHIGTFTSEGTFAAAAREIPELARLGITCIELMPIAEFPGRFGWGYDGVNLFAPTHLYGGPEELRQFVNAAHSGGVGVVLDVVYNHLGPEGNYLPQFSEDYFTDRYHTDWGWAINFDGTGSGPVREFFLSNAGYWIDEFHMDGLRIDATQNIYDSSSDSILAAIVRKVRSTAKGRKTMIIAENEPQNTWLVRPPEQGGSGMDCLWNDDFHHSAVVALTGRNEAYYTDYLGKPQEFISAVKWGYLYQGQWYKWQKKRRGTPSFGLPPEAFVNFIQNHDQLANSGRGLRVHLLTSPGCYKAMTALMLLSPGTPMLFQGQEFGASSPFHYFADLSPQLSKLVHKGRREFLKQFRSLATPEMQEAVPTPDNLECFLNSKLNLSERISHSEIYAMHKDLLRLRRSDPVFSAQKPGMVDGAVLGEEAFMLRFFADDGSDRLLLVNLGVDLHLNPAPEPLLAPPLNCYWDILWASTDPKYGGYGTPEPDTWENWQIPGNAALALCPRSYEVVGT